MTLEAALSKTTDTKVLEIGAGVIVKTPDVFKKLFPNSKAIIIADDNTWKVAGEKVCQLLKDAGIEQDAPFVISDPDLYAEWKFIEKIENTLKQTDAIAIAVGSGVLNDLTNLSSARLGRRYMCVGTAASMDGYTAFGASITLDGNKQTFSCPAPLGFVMDAEIAAKAPYELAASGYADLIAKVPAGADWIIADAMATEKLDDFAFAIVQDGLKRALAEPAKIREGDALEVEKLSEGLLLSGFAMQAIQSSRPASGIEHQFSHYWDMAHLKHNGKSISHGFKVGIGTLVSTAFLEMLLQEDIENLDIDACVANWKSLEEFKKDIEIAFNHEADFVARGITEMTDKYVDKDELRHQLESFKANWGKLKERIAKQILPFKQVQESLKLVGAPYEPEHIGVSREKLLATCKIIPYMRSRISSADIAVRAGLFDKWLDKLFGKGGIWEIK